MRYIETYEVRRMMHSQESRVSSSQDALHVRQEHRSSVSMLVSDVNSCSGGEVVSNNDHLKVEKMAATSNQDGKKSDSVYPWLSSFGDACQAALGYKSNKKLENLMKKYTSHILGSVKECYTRPNRAAKLRKCINDTLLFFHLYYQDVREPGKHSAYLDLMTELASMYVDMEIKAASRRKERVKKITCRLTSALYIFLDKSEEHILDAILKAKLINKHNRDVCLPLLGKIVNQVPSPLNEMSYVRYLLIFKLFKKVTQNAEKGKEQKAEEGKRINKLAVLKLKPPANFVEKAKIFINVLPKIPPKSKKNITHFFMQAKVNLKSACTAFLKSATEFHETLYGSSNKEVLFSKSISADLSGKSEPNAGSSNDMWSSLDLKSLVENFPLRNLTSSKKEPVVKKPKEKVKKKNKKVKGIKSKEKDLEKIRKKKLKKNKILDPCGESVTILENKLLGSKKGKGDKNKKRSNVKRESVVSSESTDESVSLPEINPTADSVHRELSVLNKLSSKGLNNFYVGSGKSFSSGDSQNIGSSGIVQKQEISNGDGMSDVLEVTAETSVSGVGREQPSTSIPTVVPSFSVRATICTALPPPPPHPCYTSPPPPPPQTPPSGHELPSTTTPRGGPPSYISLVPTEYLTSLPPKRNTDSRASSPAVPITRSSASPHMPVCSSSMPSPRRNLQNICSGLPAGFSPSIPPPPLPSFYPTRPPSLPQNSLSFQPPLPRSPAPPPPPLPGTPAPTSSGFSLPLMSVPPPLALFSTIPPPPPPPLSLSHPVHLPTHPPSKLSGRPGPTPPSHHPPSTPPPPVRPPPTPPPPTSVPPPPPPSISPSVPTSFSSSTMPITPFPPSVSLSSAHVSASQSFSHASNFSHSTTTAHGHVTPVSQANVPSVNSGSVPVCHTPPLRSGSLSSPLPSNIPSPHTPYAPTPPPSCTPTPPSPSGTPPPSPLIHTRPSPSPSLPSTSFTHTPPVLRPANSGTSVLPPHSLAGTVPPTSSNLSQSFSPSSPSPSFNSFPTCTPASPSPSPTPSRSPSPSHSLSTSLSPSNTTATPTVSRTSPSFVRVSTPPSSCMTVSSIHSSVASSAIQPTSNIPSQSISPASPSPSCTAFSSYTPASPSPAPSPSCSPSPTPSRSPSRSRTPSPSPASSPSPSYTPITLSPACTPTPSSPVRAATPPTSCKVTSLHSPIAPANLPVSVSSRITVASQSPVCSRSSSPLQVAPSIQSPPPNADLPTVTTSTISSQISNSISIPTSTVVCTTPPLSTPSLQNPTDIEASVSVDTAISVTLTETSSTETPPVSPPTTPPVTLTLEQPTTTTLMVDSPSKISQSPTVLLSAQNMSKCKGPCDSSPALLDPSSVIPCFPSSIVAPSEERIIDVGAEVEVEVEEAETEVEADTFVSQVVEESQESVLTGSNREIIASEDVNECSGEKRVSCDSAGENMLLADTDDVYSNECEAIEPEIRITGKMFSEEQFGNVSSVIAPLGQARDTVIASGGCESLGPSSSGIDSKCLVASQISKPEVQENEAIASCSKPGKVCRDTVSPRIVRDPVLVASPIPNDTESEAVTYSCDSLITSVPLVEGCSPNNEDISVQMDIDPDREIMESFTFVPATTNDEVVHDFIAASFFDNHNIILDTSHPEEGEPDSQAIGVYDHRDKIYQAFLMMHFGENFSQFGPETQDNMVQDARLHPCDIMMEEDDVQEGTVDAVVSSDDEHDKSFNSSFNSNRRRLKGGKHPAPGIASEEYSQLLDEKDVSDASPSSSVENESVLHSQLNSSYASSGFSHNDNIESRKKGLPPETPKKSQWGTVLTHTTSTPKRKPEVNNIRCCSSVEQTLQISSSESREDSSAEESPTKVPKTFEYTVNNLPHGINVFTNCTVEVERFKRSGIYSDDILDADKAGGHREPKATRARRRNASRGSRGGGASKPVTRAGASSGTSKRGRKRACEPPKAPVTRKSKQSKGIAYFDRPVTRSFYADDSSKK